MNRVDFQKVPKLRVQESKILLDAGMYAGCYYLIGYAVECAFKACFAKQTKRYDYPDKKAISAVYTHNLEDLMRASGVESLFRNALSSDKVFQVNWNIVKQWNETYRYDANTSEPAARELYIAITDRNHGVLTWLKRHW